MTGPYGAARPRENKIPHVRPGKVCNESGFSKVVAVATPVPGVLAGSVVKRRRVRHGRGYNARLLMRLQLGFSKVVAVATPVPGVLAGSVVKKARPTRTRLQRAPFDATMCLF